MCRLLETIKIQGHQIPHLFFHNKRLNQTRKELFNIDNPIDLSSIIAIPEKYINQLIKCRIIYQQKIISIEFHPYQIRKIRSLKIIHADTIEYNHKYENRNNLNQLLIHKGKCDDLLIIKNKKITDTSFTNIAFYDGQKWLTPLIPLLKGTKREKLILEKKIIPEDISLKDLKLFKKALLFNGMIEFEDNIRVDINNII